MISLKDRTAIVTGAGGFELAHVTLTQGIHLPDPATSAEQLLANWGGRRRPAGRSGSRAGLRPGAA